MLISLLVLSCAGILTAAENTPPRPALPATPGVLRPAIPAAAPAEVLQAQVVARFDVFEAALTSDEELDNPFRDARMSAEFISPAKRKISVEGFYYGGQQWRVRLSPDEEGQWRCRARLKTPGGEKKIELKFECRGTQGHGFLRVSSRNPYRLEYQDGTPFYPVGVQTCGTLQPDCDGPTPDGKWRSVSAEDWTREFAGAVNLIRTQLGQGTQVGCAHPLIPVNGPPGWYDLELAAQLDQVFRLHRRHGFSEILILLQDMSLWENNKTAFGPGRDLAGYKSLQAENLALQEQYLRYVVARYGCFVDVWEIFNEDSYADDEYLAHLAAVIRRADPYGRLLTTNYFRPGADWCQITTFHEYMGMPANQVDLYLAQQIAIYKSYGKVVQNTEFGNQGALSNVDPLKWRISVWTAFMNESGLLFWSDSGRVVPAGRVDPTGNANAYIGPDTRAHFRVFNDFVRDLPVELRPVPTGFHSHRDVRSYGLSNGAITVVYVHHFADHEKVFEWEERLMVQTGPGRFQVRWLDPATGAEIKTEDTWTAHQFLKITPPPLRVDLVGRIDRLP